MVLFIVADEQPVKVKEGVHDVFDDLRLVGIMLAVVTRRAYARGKAISLSVCCCRHENRQISRSRHLCVL